MFVLNASVCKGVYSPCNGMIFNAKTCSFAVHNRTILNNIMLAETVIFSGDCNKLSTSKGY
jgi:hypothetical protein